jgi:hypothetical protein
MLRTTKYGLRTLVIVALVSIGAWICANVHGLYDYAWSHSFVMLIGQFALLAVGTLVRPRIVGLAPFWIYSGATAYALVERAASDLRGRLGTDAAIVLAIALALALFAHVCRAAHDARSGA